jgi:galactokinase/mevalonate kinase-like predicted kinase
MPSFICLVSKSTIVISSLSFLEAFVLSSLNRPHVLNIVSNIEKNVFCRFFHGWQDRGDRSLAGQPNSH